MTPAEPTSRRQRAALTAAYTAWALVIVALVVAVGILINGGFGSHRLTWPTGPDPVHTNHTDQPVPARP